VRKAAEFFAFRLRALIESLAGDKTEGSDQKSGKGE
jgi:hypothetical protein